MADQKQQKQRRAISSPLESKTKSVDVIVVTSPPGPLS